MIWLKRKSYLNSIKILPLPVSTNFMTPNPKIFVARELLFIAPFLEQRVNHVVCIIYTRIVVVVPHQRIWFICDTINFSIWCTKISIICGIEITDDLSTLYILLILVLQINKNQVLDYFATHTVLLWCYRYHFFGMKKVFWRGFYGATLSPNCQWDLNCIFIVVMDRKMPQTNKIHISKIILR